MFSKGQVHYIKSNIILKTITTMIIKKPTYKSPNKTHSNTGHRESHF